MYIVAANVFRNWIACLYHNWSRSKRQYLSPVQIKFFIIPVCLELISLSTLIRKDRKNVNSLNYNYKLKIGFSPPPYLYPPAPEKPILGRYTIIRTYSKNKISRPVGF